MSVLTVMPQPQPGDVLHVPLLFPKPMRISLAMLCLWVFALSSACRTAKEANGYAGKEIIFGEGGGFSGKITAYTLYEDGRLWVKPMQGEPIELVTSVSRRQTRAFFKKMAALESYKLDEPGNMYYFLRFEKPGENEQPFQLTWGNADSDPPPAALDLFVELKKIIAPEM